MRITAIAITVMITTVSRLTRRRFGSVRPHCGHVCASAPISMPHAVHSFSAITHTPFDVNTRTSCWSSLILDPCPGHKHTNGAGDPRGPVCIGALPLSASASLPDDLRQDKREKNDSTGDQIHLQSKRGVETDGTTRLSADPGDSPGKDGLDDDPCHGEQHRAE